MMRSLEQLIHVVFVPLWTSADGLTSLLHVRDLATCSTPPHTGYLMTIRYAEEASNFPVPIASLTRRADPQSLKDRRQELRLAQDAVDFPHTRDCVLCPTLGCEDRFYLLTQCFDDIWGDCKMIQCVGYALPSTKNQR